MKQATQEQVELFKNFLKDNKLGIHAEPITSYPNGVSNTTCVVSLIQVEDKVEATDEPTTPNGVSNTTQENTNN